ncbi:MAG: PKD domain-containing protein [Candidatus Nanopelagicales bacterium]
MSGPEGPEGRRSNRTIAVWRTAATLAAVALVGGALVGAPAAAVPAGFVKVSVSASGVPTNSADHSDLTTDGRYVVFRSIASLATSATTGYQIFLRDLVRGTTELVSISASGAPGSASSDWPSISEDGCRVAFESDSPNLVPGDTNGTTDVFVRDRCASPPTTSLVAVTPGGAPSAGQSKDARISADGRVVVFWSYATDLVTGVFSNGQVYRRDLAAGATTLVSDNQQRNGRGGNYGSNCPSTSADGSRIAFWSYASDLVAGDDGESMWDIFVYDTTTGSTSRVSTAADGTPQNRADNGASTVTCPAISADGRWVAFASWSTNLVPGDANRTSDMFLKDTQTGAISRVSVGPGGREANGPSAGRPAISRDGTVVAFRTEATNLTGSTLPSGARAAVRDVRTGTTRMASTASVSGDDPGMSDDGLLLTSYFAAALDPFVPGTGLFRTQASADSRTVADAGVDQQVKAGATVALDGSASRDPEGSALTYRWTQLFGPTAVSFVGPTTAQPSFVAGPTGTYVFQLVVNDGGQDSDPSFVSVVAEAGPPAPVNGAPTADAGPDASVGAGATVTLDGRGSRDPEGSALTYRWTELFGPTAVSFVGPTTARPSFVATTPGTYIFQLVVNDGDLSSDPSFVSVDVQPAATLRTAPAVVKGRTAGVVGCPVSVGSACSVRVALSTTGARRAARPVAIGSATVHVGPGRSASIAVRWSKSALSLLAKKKTLAVIATTQTRDATGAVVSVTTRFVARARR